MKTTWLFNKSIQPFQPEVGIGVINFTKGPFGTGWKNTMNMTGTAQGFIDMGKGGFLNVAAPLDPQNNERTVTIRVERYNDGFIFANSFPTVAMPNWTKVSDKTYEKQSANSQLGWGGRWFIDESIWKGTGNSISFTITSPAAYPWTALINSVEIES